MSATVVVIGAGLAGLNAARILHRHNVEVKVLEAGDRVGGRVATERFHGYLLDHGFQVINPQYAELQDTGIVKDLEIQNIPKGVEVIGERSTILVGDFRQDLRFIRDSISPKSGTIREKLKFLRYLIRNSEDISFGAAMQDCGRLYSEVLEPFLTGVVLSDPSEISNRMARELIHWFLRGNPGVPRGGVARLPELLARELSIQLSTTVRKIESTRVTTTVGKIDCDAVIIATDPISASLLLGKTPPHMNSSVTYYHAIDEGEIESSYLRVRKNSPVINSVVISNSAKDYAPAGKSLVATTTLAPLQRDELNGELKLIWHRDARRWEFLKEFRIPYSLPFHGAGQDLVQESRISDRLYLAGDWRATPSQQGALLSGRKAALAVIRDLSVA